MRRMVGVLALLALAFPMAAFADTITLANQGGTIAISDMAGTGGAGTIGSSTITSNGSQLTQFNGIVAPKGHSLGSVNFMTGVLESGTVSGGGIFSGNGSSFIVTGAGNYGEPHGTIFSGSFVGNIDWTLVSKVGPKATYSLTGDLVGELYTGRMVTGMTTETITILNGQQLNQGIGHIGLGNTTLSTPEPGTLGLLGIGLLGMAGMFRRKRTRS